MAQGRQLPARFVRDGPRSRRLATAPHQERPFAKNNGMRCCENLGHYYRWLGVRAHRPIHDSGRTVGLPLIGGTYDDLAYRDA